MIITLSGADFSSSNIGILTKWRISTELDNGAVYSGPITVDKGSNLNTVIKIAEGYALDTQSIIITMGDKNVNGAYTVEDNEVKISIANVSGDVCIKLATLPLYTMTIVPMPENATVAINGIEQKSITVPAGTAVEWAVSAVDYKPQIGTQVVNDNITLNVALVEADIFNLYNPVTNPIRNGYYGNSFALHSTDKSVVTYSLNRATHTTGFDTDPVAVEGGKTYTIKLYDVPKSVTVDGDTNQDGTSEKGESTVPFGIWGIFFYETINGKPSIRYVHSVCNSTTHAAYWSTSKPAGYTGSIPCTETSDTSPFKICKGYNNDKIVITDLGTGKKTSENDRHIWGTTVDTATHLCKVEILDPSITHMMIHFGNPNNSTYQMMSNCGLLVDEETARKSIEDGLMIVEGTRLPAAYIPYQEQN